MNSYSVWPDDLWPPGVWPVLYLIWPGPAIAPDGLTFTVPAEDRSCEVEAEMRTFAVPYEDRTFEVS
jgi:hypothetical protein